MGVFTEPWERQGWLTQVLIQHHGSVCGLMYVAGFIWFLLLPHEQIQSRSYFSENSLLPGLVKGAFVEDSMAKHYLATIADEMEARPNGMPRSWLLAQMRQLGLETYTHNFTLHYPLADKVKYQGENVYGILRAPRGASTEALVLSTPFRPLSRGNPTTGPSIALMLAFAKFCRNQKYWAKDIIFLITEHEQLGMQAWLEAYHQAISGKKGVLDAGDMSGRAGAIQAAINLELHSDRISHIDVKMEGLNGQLPNLDLVNLVHVLCTKEGVHHTVHGRSSPSDNGVNHLKLWKHSLQTLLLMVTTQATGVPNGNHGLFHRFGIEAVTMEGFKKSDRGSPATYYQLGRVLEGVMRSLNNLLERFHQSYFFYLLSATDHYISIGLYMPSVGLMVSTLLIRALAIWLNMPYCRARTKQEAEDQPSIVEAAALFLAVHIGGVAFLSAPQLATHFGREWMQWPTETALTAGFTVIAVVTVMVPVLSQRGKVVDMAFLNIIALLELATLLLAVAMHNFSLAFFCSLCYVPFALLASVKRFRFLQILGWTILHPLILLVITVVVYTACMFPEGMIMAKAFNALQQALVFSVVDYLIYGNWVFSVAVAFLLPTWVLFWTVILGSKVRQNS